MGLDTFARCSAPKHAVECPFGQSVEAKNFTYEQLPAHGAEHPFIRVSDAERVKVLTPEPL